MGRGRRRRTRGKALGAPEAATGEAAGLSAPRKKPFRASVLRLIPSGTQVKKQWLKKQVRAGSAQTWTSNIRAVPEDMVLDSNARYAGVVIDYRKLSGFGFIRPAREGLVPGDELYVKWTNIQSDDRFPFLMKDMKVEFGLMKWNHEGVISLNAKAVTLPGGMNIALQDEVDLEEKTFIGAQNYRYSGMLKFYNPKQGFGYVIMDDGYALSEPVPKELRVKEVEVNCGGKRPHKYVENIAVEFGIMKDQQGKCLVYNMTLPGGVPLLVENMEQREIIGTQAYKGKVDYLNWKQGWGLIKPDPNVVLPLKARAKLTQIMLEAQETGDATDPEETIYFRKSDVERECWLQEGMTVSFQLYVDNKGVGARAIHE